MNVIHVMTGDLWAGAEVQLYETLLNMTEEIGAKVSVVLFSNGELARKLTDNNINVSVIDELENSSIAIASQLADYLNTKRPGIVHVHDYKSQVIASLAIFKSLTNPVVVRTLHGLLVVPKTLKMLKSYALSVVENLLLQYRTDCIIAVSKDIEKTIKKNYRSVRVEQINNAITIPVEKNEGYKIKLREEYNVKKDTIWIAAASRLADIKNLKMLIDAVAKIDQVDIQDIKVSIFGDGPLKHDLEQDVEKSHLSDVIKMHGHNNAVTDVMPAFDIFVNTSIHEGMPMSILEVMASGVPPVCTRVGGMKEIIEHSKNGVLVELNDTDTLADVLVSLKNDALTRKEMGKAARYQIITNYNIKNSVAMLNDVYESLLSH